MQRRQAIHEAMVRLSEGDRSVFEWLFAELWPILRAFAARAVPQPADAEDIAQQVFLKIFSRISEFDKDRDGLSWVFGIAAYEVKTHRRKVQRRKDAIRVDDLTGLPDSRPSQEHETIALELELALSTALESLSDIDRDVLLSSDTPNAAIELSKTTIRKRRQRALDRLRTKWRDLYG